MSALRRETRHLTVVLVGVEDIHAVAEAGAKAYPRLGLLALAAWTRRELAGEVDLTFHYVDQLLEGLTAGEIAARTAVLGADVVGLSAMSHAVAELKAVAASVRQACPGATLVGGGACVSSLREAAMADIDLDIAVVGEGEKPFEDILRALADGTAPVGIPGTIVRDEAGVCVSVPADPMILDVNRLPRPAFDLVDLDAYARKNPHMDEGGRFAPIMTSRGCPYRCTYCHNMHGKQVRFRSAEAALADILHLHEQHGVQVFYVYDDIFNFDLQRAKTIMRGVVDAGIDVAFDFLNGLRGDRMDRELIDLMIEAGTVYFAYAVETGTPRLQRQIMKRLNLDRIADTIDYTVRAGGDRCVVATYNMIGFPGETEAEVENTLAFNLALPHHIADVAIATPQEGTVMFEVAREHGFTPPEQRRTNYGTEQTWSASEYIEPARLAALRHRFQGAFLDPTRRSRLHALADMRGERVSQRYLGAFVRGYLGLASARDAA